MNKKFFFLVVIFVIQLVTCSAKRCSRRCANVPVMNDFNLEKYQGTWYEIQRFPNFFETHLECVKADYEYTNNNTLYAKNSGRHGTNGYIRKADAKIKMKDPESPNKLRIEYEVKFFNQTVYKSNSPYQVWKTDYDNYALVYSCRICYILGHRVRYEKAWILSRSRKLDQKYISDIKNEMISNGVDVGKFMETEQSDCDNDDLFSDISSFEF